MTIYECLGISRFLINETIPLDMIVENIDRPYLRYDAGVYFKNINRVSIRASLNRGNHFLQVIEVDLNNADYIDEISELIQMAIRYQVLFVFSYNERYLILRRSFNITLSTEHVYTNYASLCTDWIYEENLNEELAALYNTSDILNHYDENFELSFVPSKTDNDNGDHRYYDDLIGNILNLNRSVIESDVVSLRFLFDWWNLHSVGSRVNIYDVFSKIREIQAFQMIGDSLFLDKGCVCYAISELEHSDYLVSLDHTGKNPMFYFKGVDKLSTDTDIYDAMQYIIYGDTNMYCDYEITSKSNDELPEDVKAYAHINCYSPISSTFAYETHKLGFIDEIIRRHRLRGFNLIEDQDLRYSIVHRLRLNGYQMLEQLQLESISSLDFLSDAMKIELLACMDSRGFRFVDCTQKEFPSISDFIKSHYVCGLCSGYLDNINVADNKCLCSSCELRTTHLAEDKPFTVSNAICNIDDDLTTVITTFVIGEKNVLGLSENIELVDGFLTLYDNSEYSCSMSNISIEETLLTKRTMLNVTWNTDDYFLSTQSIFSIKLIFKLKRTESSCYLFEYRFDENERLKLYDYLSELDYTEFKIRKEKERLNLLITKIQDNLYTRESLEICLDNLRIPEIKAIFEENYILENNLYFDPKKTHLIMCVNSDHIENLKIPQSVTHIGKMAFAGVNKIGNIVFSNELKSIGDSAFSSVEFANDFSLPDSIVELGFGAFWFSKTPSSRMNIPRSLEKYGEHAFSNSWSLYCTNKSCKMSPIIKHILSTTDLEISFEKDTEPLIIAGESKHDFSWTLNSVNELQITADGAFHLYRWDSDKNTEWRKHAQRIKKLIFTPGVTSVGGNGFEGCDNICEVVFPSTLKYLDVATLKNTIWYKNLISKFSVVGDGCLIKVVTDDYILKIPNDIKYVSRITDSVFSEEQISPNVKRIKLGNSVNTILPFAFYGSAIESILFNDCLENIEQQALASCGDLKFLCLPNSVKSIGYGAFSYSSQLRCVVLPEKLETIYHNAFDGCYWLEKIIVPFDKSEFKNKVSKFFGRDDFPYNKCVFSTTVDNRNITNEYDLVTRKRTKWESRPAPLSKQKNIGEYLARVLRKHGINTIEDLRKWGAKGVWEYVYRRERTSRLSFESLVRLVMVDEDVPELSQEKLSELYDFADSVMGYKLNRDFGEKTERTEGLIGLLNIGSSMRTRLRSVGIKTVSDLMQTDTKIIWDRLYQKNTYTDCVEIWSIEGAKQNVLYADLDAVLKAELKDYVDFKKGREKPNPEELTTLPNIGVGLAEKLRSVGVTTSSDLKKETTESIWDRLFLTYPSVGCYEMYAIEGAKRGIKMSYLDRVRKAEIRDYVNKKHSK